MTNRMTAFLGLLCLTLTGCAAGNATLPLTEVAQSVADIRTIHVATTREESDDPLEIYSGERAYRLNYAAIDVSIPRDREPGSIIYPGETADPARQFAATSINTQKNRDAMIGSINAQLAETGGNTLVLFTHGYNTDFAEGLYRLAQMAEDYDINGAAMAYSWPSAGRTPLYLYDRDSAQYARAGLVDTIRMATETNADEIVVIGHSMGTIIVMEALRELSLSGETQVMNQLDAVLLAAPDIDVDVFRTQIADIEPRPEAFAVFVSSRDRALRVSQRIRGGHPRLGEGTDITELQEEGIAVIDLSTVGDGGFAQHNTFASSPTMIALANSGVIGRQSLINQERGANTVTAGLEGLFRLASDIVYLPATLVSQ